LFLAVKFACTVSWLELRCIRETLARPAPRGRRNRMARDDDRMSLSEETGEGVTHSTRLWPDDIFDVLREFGVAQIAYVPDAGHARLIRAVNAEPTMRGIVLTTEEEGVALAAGAWLGGDRSALLMQSSGVGNCINMLSLIRSCKFPLLTLVTMRGEWGEFNSWQVPMGASTEAALKLMGVEVVRANSSNEVADTVRHAATMVFGGGAAVAVLLSQRLIGAKEFL
jgi:sulfopyruvate decarboxylase alpha subunit